ncbi:DUF4328 domain-containing protein [uncultured Erythrobacter sp.]|uniref:DUF4328 domain-containing protein n=1 Tax=uncultured Erythrobacter sp. TaxID=263913 RepID=UPI0026336EFD|nr:DUF4328 domain-containing protein [uncultured Erythrobacter sp.]
MKAENLRVPALIATILAWAVCALTLVSALSLSIWLIAYTQMAESPIMLAISGIAAALSPFVYILSIVAVLVWVFMAHANLHRAGLTGLNYSPSWATFSFLVPIANLFVPFRAMRELANRSLGEPEELAAADVDEVFSWWGCWIGSFVVNLFLLYTLLVAIIPWLWMTTPFWATQVLIILANILTAGAAFFLIKVIKLVTNGQREGMGAAATFE